MSDDLITRRDAIRAAAAGALLASTSGAQTAPTSTPTTTTAPAAWIAPGELGPLETLTDQTLNDAHREQLSRSLNGLRGALTTIRTRAVPDGASPAFHFDVYPPGLDRPALPEAKDVTPSDAPPPAFEGAFDAIAFAGVLDLHRLLIAKRITSVELTSYFLGRCRNLGPRLHCIVNLTEERALKAAAAADARIAAGERGPLLGIPYGLKDLFAARGAPTTFGVSVYERQMLDEDAAIVRKLDAAGAVLIAKTSMGELAMGDVWFGGKTRNPWKIDDGSSGSSAGSASGVAAGLFPFAIGTETLGSILSPCATCGVVGLRPTFGRVSRGGAMTLCWTMDKPGPIARRVEDLALVFAAIHGREKDEIDSAVRDAPFGWNGEAPDVSALRVGVDRAAFDAMKRDTPEQRAVAEAYDAMLQAIESLVGKPLVPADLPLAKAFAGVTSLIIDVESSAAFANLRRRGDLDKLVQQGDGSWPAAFRAGSVVPAVDYLRAMQIRVQLQHAMAAAMADVDCYVSPVWSTPTLAFTNLCGQPTVVSRCGLRDAGGVPITFQIVGALDREDAALRLAHAYERSTDWWRATPTL